MELDIIDENIVYNFLVSLRNQLINGSDKDLFLLYKNDEEGFYNFLVANLYLKEIEPDFYLLDKRYLHSVLNIISIYRNDMESVDKVFVNDMISFANSISNLSDNDKKSRIKNI